MKKVDQIVSWKFVDKLKTFKSETFECQEKFQILPDKQSQPVHY